MKTPEMQEKAKRRDALKGSNKYFLQEEKSKD